MEDKLKHKFFVSHAGRNVTGYAFSILTLFEILCWTLSPRSLGHPPTNMHREVSVGATKDGGIQNNVVDHIADIR